MRNGMCGATVIGRDVTSRDFIYSAFHHTLCVNCVEVNGTGTFRAQDLSFPRTNSPYGNFRSRDFSFPGTFVPMERKFQRTFVPRTFRSEELSFPGLFVFRNFRSSRLFMVALCNRADHYIFILFLSSSSFSFFLFFTRLISAVGDWMFTILWHMVWP